MNEGGRFTALSSFTVRAVTHYTWKNERSTTDAMGARVVNCIAADFLRFAMCVDEEFQRPSVPGNVGSVQLPTKPVIKTQSELLIQSAS